MRRLTLAFVTSTLACLPVAAEALEGLTPYIPGATTGVAVGALPPPGFYGDEDNLLVYGQFRDGNGNLVPIKVTNPLLDVSLLWSSPYHVFGANYGAALIQIASYHQTDTTGIGGINTASFGFFNTILEPVTLSWQLPHNLFVALGQTFYLPDGEFHSAGGVRTQEALATGYFTYEPSLAISYLKNGLDLTIDNIYDVNATNHATHYSSGNVFYVDFTAAQSFGRTTLGVIGNITQQTTDDRHDGRIVGNGERIQHVLLGPMLEYDFGRFQVLARFLGDVRTRNDIAYSIARLGISTRF